MRYTRDEISKGSNKFVDKVGKALLYKEPKLLEVITKFYKHSLTYQVVNGQPVLMSVTLDFKPNDVNILLETDCL
ncbi:hypothetical protein H3N56_11225 [Cetobacterium sp. 2A]|uniref:hypothetical protein n=1 Tax=Cetobacterium sp. 2A TaxID=2754723 RepID=UPI00163B6A9E|nr:hypothetical protein [Cetobacterium sp. 2A]MBC2857004.1 hypothetical protein [Cetobacterium sp. 2A]